MLIHALDRRTVKPSGQARSAPIARSACYRRSGGDPCGLIRPHRLAPRRLPPMKQYTARSRYGWHRNPRAFRRLAAQCRRPMPSFAGARAMTRHAPQHGEPTLARCRRRSNMRHGMVTGIGAPGSMTVRCSMTASRTKSGWVSGNLGPGIFRAKAAAAHRAGDRRVSHRIEVRHRTMDSVSVRKRQRSGCRRVPSRPPPAPRTRPPANHSALCAPDRRRSR